MPDIASLEKALGLSFRDQGFLHQALVHSSYANENPGMSLGSNERLEFLGDALVGLVVGHEVYDRYAHLSEGELTALRSQLVRGETLAQVAEFLHLGQYLYMGQGEIASGGRSRPSNLAAAFEALVGALFLDQGYEIAREFTLKAMSLEMERVFQCGVAKDPKSRLQEVVQALGMSAPDYRTVELTGPDHEPRFTVEVLIDGKPLGLGRGRRKVQAEQEAARQALEALN